MKARMPPARSAKNPRTTMTAMAQWGKLDEPSDDWMPPGFEPLVACADDADAADTEDIDADELEANEELTESRIVVSNKKSVYL
jgi:hypothetical protein